MIFIAPHWLPIKYRIQFKVLAITFRSHQRSTAAPAPCCHQQVFKVLRSGLAATVVLLSRLSTKVDCAFEVVASDLWNSPISL